MTVAELIKILKGVDPDLKIWAECSDADYSGFLESADFHVGPVWRIEVNGNHWTTDDGWLNTNRVAETISVLKINVE